MVTGEAASPVVFEDEKLRKVPSRECHLALRIDRDALQFAITENHDDYFLYIFRAQKPEEETPIEFLSQMLEKDPLLRQEYHSVSLAVAGEPALAVPSGVFEDSNKRDLISLHLGRKVDKAADVSVEMGGLQWLYEYPEQVEKLIKTAFPNAVVKANSAWMVQSMLRKSKWSKESIAYLDLSGSFFDFYLVKDGELLFYNCFDIQSETDVLYHLMNTMQKLDIKPEDQRVLLSGPVDVGGNTMKLLRKYLNRVELNFGMDFYQLSRGLSGVKKQYFVSLMNQYVCA